MATKRQTAKKKVANMGVLKYKAGFKELLGKKKKKKKKTKY